MRKFGLIGKTLGHSFSKGYFTALFEQQGIEARYDNYELAAIEDVLPLFDLPGLEGLNVTIPYKEAIIPYLDELSPEAAAIGAVNVIALRNGRKIGYNTDAFGFQQSIKPFLTNLHERALVLGTGGASKAVTYVLKAIGLEVVYISRTAGTGTFGYEDINEHMLRACKVIINCTPVGTFPDTTTIPFPYEHLTEEHLVIDLIYNPEQTGFLRESAAQGAATLNGLSMLKEQAAKAWAVWNA